jgi:hypothetical protein
MERGLNRLVSDILRLLFQKNNPEAMIAVPANAQSKAVTAGFSRV